MIGEAIKGYDRSKIQLLTKFGLVWDGSNQGKGEFFFDAEEAGKTIPVYKYASKTSVIKELEDSLKTSADRLYRFVTDSLARCYNSDFGNNGSFRNLITTR